MLRSHLEQPNLDKQDIDRGREWVKRDDITEKGLVVLNMRCLCGPPATLLCSEPLQTLFLELEPRKSAVSE